MHTDSHIYCESSLMSHVSYRNPILLSWLQWNRLLSGTHLIGVCELCTLYNDAAYTLHLYVGATWCYFAPNLLSDHVTSLSPFYYTICR